MGIDFIGPLPISKNWDGEYNAITVIIDQLTLMVHLVSSRTNYTAHKVAELVFTEVYKHHGLPKSIVSNHGILFTSTFWTHLNALIGIEQNMFSAYHPESDGTTERANRTVIQMLQSIVSPVQMDWVTKLPAIKFAINLVSLEMTLLSPFEANTGRTPRVMVWNNPSKDKYPSMRAYLQRMKAAQMNVHDSMLEAHVKQIRHVNKRHQLCPLRKETWLTF